jgi:hypothetical protein
MVNGHDDSIQNGVSSMNQNQSLIGKIFAWGTNASYSDTTVQQWLMGLALIMVLAFLWSLVVKQIIE